MNGSPLRRAGSREGRIPARFLFAVGPPHTRAAPSSPHFATAGAPPPETSAAPPGPPGGFIGRSGTPRGPGALVCVGPAGGPAGICWEGPPPPDDYHDENLPFVRGALLIVWLFKLAIKGSRSPESLRTVGETPVGASQAVAS